jgi:hypothetical protein
MWARAHGVVPRWRAKLGRLPAPQLGRNPPPGPLSREIPFLFSFFYFFFPFSYVYAYIDILCTKNSLNKLYGTK